MGVHDRDWYRNPKKKRRYRDKRHYEPDSDFIFRWFKFISIAICLLAIILYLILNFWPAGGDFLRNTAMKLELLQSSELSSLFSRNHDIEFSESRPETHSFQWTDSHLNIQASSSVDQSNPILVDVSVDAHAADLIRNHFGTFAKELLSALDGVDQNSIARGKLEEKQQRLLSKHGIRSDGVSYGPDYDWLVEQSLPFIQPAAVSIVAEYRTLRPNDVEHIDLHALISFVQGAIGYEVPLEDEDWFELRPPLSVLLERNGDCDSKSILLVSLIRSIDQDIPLAIITGDSPDGPHAVVGIGMKPGDGQETILNNGILYVLVETTDQWGIGDMGWEEPMLEVEVNQIR